jgi:DNA-binding Lrp family transcriptional regulator
MPKPVMGWTSKDLQRELGVSEPTARRRIVNWLREGKIKHVGRIVKGNSRLKAYRYIGEK